MTKVRLLILIISVSGAGYFTASKLFLMKDKDKDSDSARTEQINSKPGVIAGQKTASKSIVASDSTSALSTTQNHIPQEALKEVRSEQFVQNTLVNGAGFTEEGAKSLMERRNISIEDLPPDLRESRTKALEDIKKNGYAEVEEEDASRIIDMEENLVGKASDPIKNLNFLPAKIPETLSSEYNYTGYGFNPSGEKQSGPPADSLQRLFKSSDSAIVLDETPLHEDFVSSPTKEFINATVGGHDAIYESKRTASGRMYTMLNWSDGKRVYTLNQFGKPLEKGRLIEIADSLDQLNK